LLKQWEREAFGVWRYKMQGLLLSSAKSFGCKMSQNDSPSEHQGVAMKLRDGDFSGICLICRFKISHLKL
jgi:hypothetical protein